MKKAGGNAGFFVGEAFQILYFQVVMPRESGASSTPQRSFCTPHLIGALEYWLDRATTRERILRGDDA